jgi:hypothetical protein
VTVCERGEGERGNKCSKSVAWFMDGPYAVEACWSKKTTSGAVIALRQSVNRE